MSPAPSRDVRIGVCVVTYQERFDQCAAYRSLSALPLTMRDHLAVVSVCNAAASHAVGENRVDATDGQLAHVEFIHTANDGLAGGYNIALREIIGQQNIAAVLFLNADANVEPWYVDWLLHSQEEPDVDAWGPTLQSGGRQVSPFRRRGMEMPFYIIGYLCIRNGPFLRNLQFPKEFWLDGIDYWLSAEMSRAKLAVRVHSRTVRHDLSVSDQFHTLPAWRYRNILVSERRFAASEGRPFSDVVWIYSRAFARCLIHRRTDLALVVAREFIVGLNER